MPVLRLPRHCTLSASLAAATLLLGGCAQLPPMPDWALFRGEKADSTETTATTEFAPETPATKPTPAVTPELAEVEDDTPTEQDEVLSQTPWQRIANSNAFPQPSQPLVQQPLVNRFIAWHKARPDYLARVADRARPHLARIVDTLDEAGLPAELAIVPIVESGYQELAVSPSGAAGIWQFMPATGRRFGLTQDYWFDKRRDVPAATDAAVLYLSSLHQRFGDWLLALAAYNAGEAKVARAIRRNRVAGRPTDFFSLKLPRETTNYVPQILAVNRIIESPGTYGITLDYAAPPVRGSVAVDGQVDLTKLAIQVGIGVDEIRALNPALKRKFTPPGQTTDLVFPVDHVAKAEGILARELAALRPQLEQYQVQPGDSLWRIARRRGISVTALRETNQLSRNMLQPGEILLLPPPSPGATRTLSPITAQGGDEHVVSTGDSLWTIARAYSVTVSELARWNGIARTVTLQPGQRLRVRSQEAKQSADAMHTNIEPNSGSAAKVHRVNVHRVKDGDSLWLVARTYGVSVGELRSWNGLVKGETLHPGQVLRVAAPTTSI